MTTQIHATAERGNGWWVVTFSVDGTEFGTQAKRLDQINDMVADAASLMTGRPESNETSRSWGYWKHPEIG